MQHVYIRQPPSGTPLAVFSVAVWTFLAIRTYHIVPISKSSEFLIFICVINAVLNGWRIISEWLTYWKWKRAWMKVYNEDPLVMSIREDREWREKLLSNLVK